MKSYIITKAINLVKTHSNYNEIKIAEIKYGLESLYLLISKTIVIVGISFILNIFNEFLTFALLYNLIRMPSFGLHATKSWICWVSSIIIFISIPFLCSILKFNNIIKLIITIICIFLISKNAPADTHKKPIVNKKRRMIYKYISVIIAITFSLVAIITKNNLLANSLLFALIIQNIMISPFTYKIFGLPYNNYITYIKNNQLNRV